MVITGGFVKRKKDQFSSFDQNRNTASPRNRSNSKYNSNSSGSSYSSYSSQFSSFLTMGGNSQNSDVYKVVGMVGVLFLFFTFSNSLLPSGVSSNSNEGTLRGSAGASNCRTVWCLSTKEEFHFGIVADLDRQSKVSEAKKPEWRSWFKQGVLRRTQDDQWSVSWSPDVELRSNLGEAGRGLELSELVHWDNRLWTFDDRSGVVFEINKQQKTIPRHILMEGDGENSKGQKTEWATVKDGRLYVGSFGKPYTNSLGEVTTRNNLWISIIDRNGQITHENWEPYYQKMQQVTNSEFPGYMIHEAIHWDEINKLWYVLPRRVSSEPYDEKKDEEMGSNLLLAFDETFTSLERKLEIGTKVPTHGWSSLSFVPWTKNQVIIALRTEELEDKATGEGSQQTFLTVFDALSGEVYLPEQKIPGDYKFEGIEFL